LIQNDVTADAMIPQLLNLLRMKKIRDIEAYWIAATFWNKALDLYALDPPQLPPSLQMSWFLSV
jgi:hypothetical protein